MIETWNPDQNAPTLQARALPARANQLAKMLEGLTVALEWLVGLVGLVILSAGFFLVLSIFGAQINLHDINASGFWRQ
jgi:hypothetical protein